MNSPRARDSEGRSAEMFGKQPAQVARTDAESGGKLIETGFIHDAFRDQPQRARHDRRTAQPGGCPRSGFRTTAPAGTKSGGFGGGGASEPSDVFRLGRTDAANRAAVNAGGYDAAEESPVETRVAAQNRLIADCRIQFHARHECLHTVIASLAAPLASARAVLC